MSPEQCLPTSCPSDLHAEDWQHGVRDSWVHPPVLSEDQEYLEAQRCGLALRVDDSKARPREGMNLPRHIVNLSGPRLEPSDHPQPCAPWKWQEPKIALDESAAAQRHPGLLAGQVVGRL